MSWALSSNSLFVMVVFFLHIPAGNTHIDVVWLFQSAPSLLSWHSVTVRLLVSVLIRCILVDRFRSPADSHDLIYCGFRIIDAGDPSVHS
jgi:hypothetical protein